MVTNKRVDLGVTGVVWCPGCRKVVWKDSSNKAEILSGGQL